MRKFSEFFFSLRVAYILYYTGVRKFVYFISNFAITLAEKNLSTWLLVFVFFFQRIDIPIR